MLAREAVTVEQFRSIAVKRLGERIGIIPGAIMREVDDALRLHLGL
jgi:mRNA-degrading endonuclease toxin of MazEF toxin-antitoxin module